MSLEVGRPTPRPRGVEVVLPVGKLCRGMEEGARRQTENLRLGRRDRFRPTDPLGALGSHVRSACGELAVSVHFNVAWTGEGEIDAPYDVHRWQIRTPETADRCLLVRPDDPSGHPYVLVVGDPPTMRIVGWLPGHEAKAPRWLRNPGGYGPCYLVPQSALRPLETLPGARPARVWRRPEPAEAP